MRKFGAGVIKVIGNIAKFFYQLFFTRDDDLDILQVLFAAIVVTTLMVAWHVATAPEMDSVVRIESMVTLRWLTGLLVVTAVPKWLVPYVVDAKSKAQASLHASVRDTKQLLTEDTNAQ